MDEESDLDEIWQLSQVHVVNGRAEACGTACGILVPRPGIEPVPPALETQSLNHWTAREVSTLKF